MTPNYGIPEDVLGDHLNILTVASALSSGNIPDSEIMPKVERIGVLLHSLMKKHLSDSPGVEDKRRFGISVFEAALKIAKGEMIV